MCSAQKGELHEGGAAPVGVRNELPSCRSPVWLRVRMGRSSSRSARQPALQPARQPAVPVDRSVQFTRSTIRVANCTIHFKALGGRFRIPVRLECGLINDRAKNGPVTVSE